MRAAPKPDPTDPTVSQRYYAYGRERVGKVSDLPTDYAFTGQKQDSTGLMYFNARYFDPQIGAFISPDTLIPTPTDLYSYNRYMAFRGNPMKYTDPTGHFWHIVGGFAGGFVGSVAVQAGSQMWSQWQNDGAVDLSKVDIDWGDALGSGVQGALFTAGVGWAGGVGTATGVVGKLFMPTATNLAIGGAVGGAIGNLIGGQANSLVSATWDQFTDSKQGFNTTEFVNTSQQKGLGNVSKMATDATTGALTGASARSIEIAFGGNPTVPRLTRDGGLNEKFGWASVERALSPRGRYYSYMPKWWQKLLGYSVPGAIDGVQGAVTESAVCQVGNCPQ